MSMIENTVLAPDDLASHLRYGRQILLLIDNSAGSATGIVVVAAELCEAQHITFMARQARGLVCLGLTRERCDHLHLPLMVEGDGAAAPFTLSIEAAEGIDTGISAADRAHTVRVAVAPDALASDLVQPGHIFPVAAAAGGVLTRADRAEAATDLAQLAGLSPAAVFTDVLDEYGDVASGDDLLAFAQRHELPVGRLSDLVNWRLANQLTIERVREGEIDTAHGPLQLTVYREINGRTVHMALSRGNINKNEPTLVRVHVTSVLRDLIGTTLDGRASWRFDLSLRAVCKSERGVLVVISRPETPESLLASIDRILGQQPVASQAPAEGWASVGLGAQILHDLGVGQIHLMGAPLKYNALAGFGLEVLEFVAPDSIDHTQE